MYKLPKTFCWTKLGAESGEQIQAIIRRKEWERQLGDGYFFWGIGYSLGKSARQAKSDVDALKAIFSPIKSKAKSIDEFAAEVVLWNSWLDLQGNLRPLPNYCFITSRAILPSGGKKQKHYALVCFSKEDLGSPKKGLSVSPSCLRNLKTNKPLGSSQVTSIVRVSEDKGSCKDKSYSVSFSTELVSPYCIQLAQPIALTKNDLAQIKSVSNSNGDVESWFTLVKGLRSRGECHAEWIQCSLALDANSSNQKDLDLCPLYTLY